MKRRTVADLDFIGKHRIQWYQSLGRLIGVRLERQHHILGIPFWVKVSRITPVGNFGSLDDRLEWAEDYLVREALRSHQHRVEVRHRREREARR